MIFNRWVVRWWWWYCCIPQNDSLQSSQRLWWFSNLWALLLHLVWQLNLKELLSNNITSFVSFANCLPSTNQITQNLINYSWYSIDQSDCTKFYQLFMYLQALRQSDSCYCTTTTLLASQHFFELLAVILPPFFIRSNQE